MTQKKIKILTKGIIPVKSYIYGPVLTPYYETIDMIFQLLAAGAKVVEVCDDGTEIAINTSNFDKDNSKKARDVAENQKRAKESAIAAAAAEKAKNEAEKKAAEKKTKEQAAIDRAAEEDRRSKVNKTETEVTDERPVTYTGNNKKNKNKPHNIDVNDESGIVVLDSEE